VDVASAVSAADLRPAARRAARLHGCRQKTIPVGNGRMKCWPWPCGRSSSPKPPWAGGLSRRFPRRRPKPPCSSSNQLLALSRVGRDSTARRQPRAAGLDSPCPPRLTLRRERVWTSTRRLTFITTPNAPTGSRFGTAALRALCAKNGRVVVLDERTWFRRRCLYLSASLDPNVIRRAGPSRRPIRLLQRVGYAWGLRP